MDIERHLEIVEAENETLRERVRQLEAVLSADDVELPWEWGLTGSERCVFGVLLSRKVATKDAIMAALYRSLGRDEAEEKIVDVYICKIRRKLKAFGVTIITRFGAGYELDADCRNKLMVAA